MTDYPETVPSAGADDIKAAIDRVSAQIDAACRRVGRDPASVGIVAVTKSVPVERIRFAIDAGMGVLGENRVQEAESKAPDLGPAEWHFLGRLQSNKVARAVRLFDVIQSVDSVDLARRVARAATETERAPYPVYVQVNVDRDPAKAGVLPEAAEDAIAEVAAMNALELRGLMTVGRLVADAEQARAAFAALRDLSTGLRARASALGAGLSMGMSDDFEVAVEEGATLVRLGRAIFGAHPAA